MLHRRAVFGTSMDDAADQQISAAFRRKAGLLAPEEIRQGRERLALPKSSSRTC